jgi:hypothetical protein
VIFPTRLVVTTPTPRTPRSAPGLAGGLSAFVSPVSGLPADVPDAEVFNSDTIYAPGFNQFMLEAQMNSTPLNTVDCSVIYLDPITQAQLTSDFIGSMGTAQGRIPFGAGTAQLSSFPWLMFQIQVTSSGGVTGLNIRWRLFFGSV